MAEGMTLVFLVVLGIIYAFLCMFGDTDDDFDEITEAKCKTCVNYSVCSRHGREYGCKDYYNDEMLKGGKQ